MWAGVTTVLHEWAIARTFKDQAISVGACDVTVGDILHGIGARTRFPIDLALAFPLDCLRDFFPLPLASFSTLVFSESPSPDLRNRPKKRSSLSSSFEI